MENTLCYNGYGNAYSYNITAFSIVPDSSYTLSRTLKKFILFPDSRKKNTDNTDSRTDWMIRKKV